jgi:magnesium-protoporphyrin O-methyltransferase
MPGCCSSDYRRFFNRKVADRELRRYRRRGLRSTERDLVELSGDVRGATVLEAGGGIGALQLRLLEDGAAGATNVELSGGYENAAAELFAGREEVTRLVGDLVAVDVPTHDVVLMHRVVCCYPDATALVGAAAARAGRRLALTYPQRRRWLRLAVAVANLWLRLRRCGFRTYLHPFANIEAAAEAEGLRLERRIRRGLVWESAAFSR